jgi:chromosome partitioning protein
MLPLQPEGRRNAPTKQQAAVVRAGLDAPRALGDDAETAPVPAPREHPSMAKKKVKRRARGADDVPKNLTNNNGVIRDRGLSSTSHEPQVEVEALPDPEGAVSITTKAGTTKGTKSADVPDGPILHAEELPGAVNGDAPAPLELPRVIAIANQKGGVGKTTTAVNLGAALADAGFRVLIVDLDPQGNATTGVGLNPRDVSGSIYDVIMSDAAMDDCIEATAIKNLFVAPATIDLAGAEIELVPQISRELKLKRALDSVRDQFDIALIDCPPSLGLLTVNGLAAADDVIVPIQCEYYALEGLGQLLRNVALVQANLNPSLDVRGIILTMYDARTKLADQVVDEVRDYFGPKVYKTVVPRTVRLSEAPSYGQPITVFDSTSRGAKAYRELAKEVSHGATRRAG